MRSILWATLSANGNYARSTPEHPPKPEALADFGAHVQAAGNFIVGRETFELNRTTGGSAPAGTDIVVVTSRPIDVPGITTATSPKEALEEIASRGHTTALIVGGAGLHNSFLREGLIDELVLNVSPVLEDAGLNLVLPEGRWQDVELLETKSLGGGVVQLRYELCR